MFNLLLVDDEPNILEGLSNNIDWSQLDIHEVFTAGCVQQAKEILYRHRVDLVITDIEMPGQDGLTLGEMILHDYPYTKVIVLTGYQNFSYAQRSVDIRVFRYLLKPVRYEELQQVAGAALTELQKELKNKAELETAKRQVRQALPVFQRQYLQRWLEKDAARPYDNPEEAEGLLRGDLSLCYAEAMRGSAFREQPESPHTALSKRPANPLLSLSVCRHRGGKLFFSPHGRAAGVAVMLYGGPV